MTEVDITANEAVDQVVENDVDLFDETDETEETATATEDNQTETEEAGGIEETNQNAEEVKYTLEHLGEVKEVSLEEMKNLAQKGWDYDHVRQGYDQYKGLFNELTGGAEITPQQFVEEYRRGMMEAEIQEKTAEIMESELVSENIAQRLARAEIENQYANSQRENAMRAENQRRQAEAQQKQQVMADIEMLAKIRPEVTEPNFQIPDEVMKMAASGMPLSSAYLGWVARQSEVKATQLEQTLKNGQKSVGSMKSTGGNETDDFIDALFSD